MDQEQQTSLQALNSEFAVIVAEAREAGITEGLPGTGGPTDRARLLFEPAEMYARAIPKPAGSNLPDTDNLNKGDYARAIRMMAAKIRAGDRGYIIESLLGQAMWLQATALNLSDYAAGVKDERRKVLLCQLLLKMQVTSTKALASLAGISCLEKR